MNRMIRHQKFSCYIMGESTLPMQCGEILLASGHEICGVVSNDNAVRRWALERDIPTASRATDMAEFLGQRPFDYLFSIVNERILREDVLSLPGKLAINYHDGPLPKYAGTHATSWALMNREQTHGVSWHVISDRVDAGQILKQRQVEIAKGETALTLNTKCYEAAIGAFAELVDDLSRDRLVAVGQSLAERTFYPRFKRPQAASVLSWRKGAEEIAAIIHALDFGPHPNPLGAPKILLGEDYLIIQEAAQLVAVSNQPPGTIVEITHDSISVATTSHDIALKTFFTIDGSPLSIEALIDHYHLRTGKSFAELTSETATRLEEVNGHCCKHESYWVKRLTGLQAPDLPYVARNNVGKASARYAYEMMQVPPETHHFLATQQATWTVREYLLAAWAAYLSRIGNIDCYDLGYRDSALHKDLDGIEKLFASYLPLHIELDTLQDFMTWSSILQQRLDEVRTHKTYLRDVVVRYPELRAGIKADHKYFLPVNVELVEKLEGYTPTPEGELTLLIPKDGTQCLWVYDSRVLDRASVARMMSQFSAFLLGIASDPVRSMATQPLMNQADLHQVLVEWNDTNSDYPKDKCIHHLVEAQAARTPDAIAVVYEEKRLTYRELNERANQLAHYLRKLGVGPEVLVGICVERSLEMVIGLLGILKAGGAYVPLDPAYPQERLAYMLEEARATVLLTQKKLKGHLQTLRTETICIDSEWSLIRQEKVSNPAAQAMPDNLAYVIYTSGSTGKPKGVLIEHRSLLNLVFWHQRAFDVSRLDRATQLAGTGFDAAVWELWPYLAAGASIYIPNDEVRSSPAQLVKWFASQAISISFLPTPLAEAALSVTWPHHIALRILLTGGDRLNHYAPPSLPFKFVNNYGPTEGTVVTTSGLVPLEMNPGKAPHIGRPIANMKVYLLDANLQPVPIGIAGELYVGGDGVARGYLNLPELSSEKFIPNPFSRKTSARLYKTGDLARHLPDGNIEFLGRIDHQVKIRGFRIELGEIEAVLGQFKGVREAVVLAREDEPDAKRLVAYFVADSEAEIAIRQLRDFLRDKLPEFMVPSAFVKLDALPLTPNGKVDRRALPVPEPIRTDNEETFIAHRDLLEQQLTHIWEEILSIRPIGVTDNFFELGGHSLLAVRMFAQIDNKLGRKLPLATLFQAPTIEQLANVLRAEKEEVWSSLVAIQPAGSKPPFFCIHARGGNVLFYRDLARHLGTDQPFYGLQAQGLDGKQPYHTKIEEMAAHYIKEIKKIQAEGPYYIGGSSFGGTAAFEIAQQLHAQGEKVALLALFDTGGPDYPKFRPVTTLTLYENRVQNVARRVDHTLRALRMLEPGRRREYIRQKAKKIKVKFQRRLRKGLIKLGSKLPSSIGRPLLPSYVYARWALLDFEKAIGQALNSYVHRVYPGRLTLFRASKQPLGIYEDPSLGWEKLVGGAIELYEVPGLHGTIVTEPNVRFLADQLKRCLAVTPVVAPQSDVFNTIESEVREPEYLVSLTS